MPKTRRNGKRTVDQKDKKRRIERVKTFYTKKIIPEFGSVNNMLAKSEEASIFNIAKTEGIPSVDKKKAELQEFLKMEAKEMIFGQHFTQSSYNYLQRLFKNKFNVKMPSYRTVSASMRKTIDPLSDPLFVFDMLDYANRNICSKDSDFYYISLSNRFVWIFHLLLDLLKRHNLIEEYETDVVFSENDECEISDMSDESDESGCEMSDEFEISVDNSIPYHYELCLVSFFWYDGGKISKNLSGLASGIKIAAVELKDNTGSVILLPKIIQRYFISCCWILSCKQVQENQFNVRKLEDDLHQQYIFIKENWKNVVQSGVKLSVNIIGVTSDHGIRCKLIPRDNNDKSRCGECSYLFIVCCPYRFLDWMEITKSEIINSSNWNSHRNVKMPPLIHLASTLSELGLITYDNLHFVGGHLKEFTSLISSLVPNVNQPYLLRKFKEITGKESDYYYQSWHWRKLSLHFKDIFLPLCTNSMKDSLSCLFELITEIHIFNYIHWDRNSDDFEILRLRYTVLLFMYTYQLKDVFSAEEAATLDTTYCHKLLLHSLIVFMFVNLASCSCESGEGLISRVRRFYVKHKNDNFDAGFLSMLNRFLFSEYDRVHSSAKTTKKSKVFTDNFMASYSPKPINLLLFDSDMHNSFKQLLEYCDFSSEFIGGCCKFSRVTYGRLRGGKIFSFKDGRDAIVMKKQLLDDIESTSEITLCGKLENKYGFLLKYTKYRSSTSPEDKPPERCDLFRKEKHSDESYFGPFIPLTFLKEVKNKQKIFKKLQELVPIVDNLNRVKEKVDTDFNDFSENAIDSYDKLPLSWKTNLNETLASSLGYKLNASWKHKFQPGGTPNTQLKKKFALSLFEKFVCIYEQTITQLESVYHFYSKISSLPLQYYNTEEKIDNTVIASMLVSDCALLECSNRKFWTEMKKAADNFYSIFSTVYSNVHLLFMLGDSIVADFFTNFVDARDSFNETYQPEPQDPDYEVNSPIDDQCSSSDSEENDYSNISDTSINEWTTPTNTRYQTRSSNIQLLKSFDSVLQRIKQLPYSKSSSLGHLEKLSKELLYSDPQESGVQVYPESDDGHCAFRSIANQLYVITGLEITHIKVREAALQELINDENAMSSFSSVDEYDAYVDMHKTVINNGANTSCNSNAYCDGILLSYIVKSQRVDIFVFSPVNPVFKIAFEGSGKVGSCFLLLWEKQHYDTILYKPEHYNEQTFNELLNRSWNRKHSSN